MFKKVSCPECQSVVEDVEYECPVCHHHFDKNKKNRGICFVPWWKQIVLFVVGFLFFQIFATIFSFIMQYAAIARLGPGTFEYYYFLTSYRFSALINFTSYFVVFAILGAFLVVDSPKLLSSFKNWKAIIAGLIGLGAILLFNMVYNTILNITGMTLVDNANENAINLIVAEYPIVAIIVFGILGPICEEITYRVGLFSFFARVNKLLAYVITIIIFAFIHFDFQSTTMINELLNMPLYAFAAFVFCFLYNKFGFASSVTAHVANNLLSIVVTVIGNLAR